MVSVILIGTGNVATQLYDNFLLHPSIKVVQVIGRSAKSLAYFTSKTETSLITGIIKKADVYFIAISDDAIETVAHELTDVDGLVVHTSGSVPLSILSKLKRIGVFYPLQTFTKEKKLDFRNIPICLEIENKEEHKALNFIAETISNTVYDITSEQRKSLHLAAVFVNNFTNYMYRMGQEICEEHEVPFAILKPLIHETANKIDVISPENAQTGPARRNDIQTMQLHLDQLQTDEKKEIYKLLSESIQKKYKSPKRL
jgi:predicted short-subunit dehydrogenase-like oxidoreductase (DUF2520 family)